jgi:VIT1/CCC1 family predicted Fe2+/Mn2+ transporter
VTRHLEIIGIPPENTALRNSLIDHYENDSSALLKLMVALEFGVVEEEKRSALTAALFSGVLFILGSLPSVLPFIPKNQTPNSGLLIAALSTSISLLLVGAVKTWATRGRCLCAAIENLVIAGLGGTVAYFVGRLFNTVLH